MRLRQKTDLRRAGIIEQLFRFRVAMDSNNRPTIHLPKLAISRNVAVPLLFNVAMDIHWKTHKAGFVFHN
jgi:hypothetical protein